MRTVLNGINLIDGTGKDPLQGAFLAIQDGRLDDLGREEEYRPRDEDKCLQCSGLTVLPGLFDVHVHIHPSGHELEETGHPPKYASRLSELQAVMHLRAHLEAGFTTIRDVGSENDPIWALRHATRQGWFPSPRLFACGKLLTTTTGHGTEYGVDMAWECDGASDLIKAVRRQHFEGADFIKVIASRRSKDHPEGYPSWAVKELRAAVDEAHALGLKVAAHVSGCPESPATAVEAGVDSLEHGWSTTEKTFAMAAKKGIFFIPTLSVDYQLEKLAKEGKWRRSHAEYIRLWGSLEDRFREVQVAKEQGVRIACGTDAGNPNTFHGESAFELEMLVKAGLTPLEAITAATRNSAMLCSIEKETGTLEKGKIADLILLDGNPLENIQVLRDRTKIKAVFQAGKQVAGDFGKECK